MQISLSLMQRILPSVSSPSRSFFCHYAAVSCAATSTKCMEVSSSPSPTCSGRPPLIRSFLKQPTGSPLQCSHPYQHGHSSCKPSKWLWTEGHTTTSPSLQALHVSTQSFASIQWDYKSGIPQSSHRSTTFAFIASASSSFLPSRGFCWDPVASQFRHIPSCL